MVVAVHGELGGISSAEDRVRNPRAAGPWSSPCTTSLYAIVTSLAHTQCSTSNAVMELWSSGRSPPTVFGTMVRYACSHSSGNRWLRSTSVSAPRQRQLHPDWNLENSQGSALTELSPRIPPSALQSMPTPGSHQARFSSTEHPSPIHAATPSPFLYALAISSAAAWLKKNTGSRHVHRRSRSDPAFTPRRPKTKLKRTVNFNREKYILNHHPPPSPRGPFLPASPPPPPSPPRTRGPAPAETPSP